MTMVRQLYRTCRRSGALFVLASGLVFSAPASASKLEDLAKDGYGVVLETTVDDEFEGCDFGKHIKLSNGMVFVCSEYNYSYSNSPEFYVLKNVLTGQTKTLIDDEEFSGTLHAAR